MKEISAEPCNSGGVTPSKLALSPCSVMELGLGVSASTSYEYDLTLVASPPRAGDGGGGGSSGNTKENDMALVHDLIGLTHLDEPAILHALRLRYNANIIYTSTGPILIAVNPFQKMDHLYSLEVMERYRRQGEGILSAARGGRGSSAKQGRSFEGGGGATATDEAKKEKLPPHAYKTADDAYRAMKRGIENTFLMNSSKRNTASEAPAAHANAPTNQSILVSGESGAGKTVTTKIALHYFAMLSKQIVKEEQQLRFGRSTMMFGAIMNHQQSAEDGGIEQQVLQSNPILEAFGNARTLRNDNSSRFGKYIDIRFTSAGKLAGAKIDTYLLEKVRLIRPSTGERNYHIFYQFLAAATSEERSYLGLDGLYVDHFKLLNCTGGTMDRRDGVVDGEMHREMLDAMVTIGFEPETISSILRLITAILHCGNITFTHHHESNQHSMSDACSMDMTHSSVSAARLLGVKYDDFSYALTYRDIMAGNEVIHSPLDKTASVKACEALMKALYGALFDFIVQRVNDSISQHNGFDREEGSASIGVLDIFGFEIFNTNNFEQLCINYTNEALQQQFNKYVFKLEQEEYEKEGINWKWITFPDNQDVLDLIDRKHTGMLALLDEQCIVPRSSDAKLARYLYAKCNGHARFSATSAQKADFQFSIEHYAGPVEYSTDHWLEKNNDQLPVSSANLLKGSELDLLSKIQKFICMEDRQGRGSVASTSVGAQFSVQLSKLRARIDATVPHYIRCLKPNDAMVPDNFDPEMIVDQLRCGGVLEAVRVSRAGYPTRYPHDVFKARYYILGCGKANGDKMIMGGDTEVERLIGKIAFSIWQADHEEKGHEAKSFHNTITNGDDYPETVEQFLALDFSSRCTVAGLQLGRSKVFLRREALDRIETLRAEKFGVSALAIQRIVRGVQARDYFKLFWRKVMHSAIVIQRAYRGYVQRLTMAPAAIKVQAIARGAIIRWRLSGHSKTASKRVWIPYTEFEALQSQLETVKAQRDELLSAKSTMKWEIERLESTATDITDAKETETKKLQEELAEKVLVQNELSAVKIEFSEIRASKEAAINNLEKELVSLRKELDCSKEAACAKEAETKKLQQELAEKVSMQEEISTLNSKVSEITDAKELALENLEKKLASIHQQQLDDAKDAVGREKKRVLSVLEIVRAERDELLEGKETMESEIDNLRKKVKDIAVAKETEAIKLQEELAERVLTQKSLESKVSEITADKEASIDKLEEDLASVQQQFDDATDAARKEENRLEMELEVVTKERDDLLSARLLTKGEIERLERIISNLTDAKEAETKKLEDELADKASLQEEILTLNSKVSKITTDNEVAMNHLQKNLASIQQQLDDAKEAACQEQKRYQTKLESATSERDELLATNADMKSEIEMLDCKVQDITDAKEIEGKKLHNELAEKVFAQEKLSEIAAEKEAAIHSLEKNLASVQQEFDGAKEAACENDKRFQTELESLSNERDELIAAKAAMASQIENLENTLADLSDDKDAESKELQKELAEKLTLQNKLSWSEKKVSEITAAKEAAVQELEEKMASFDKALDDAKEASFQEEKRFQKELESITSERDEHLMAKATMKSEIDNLKSKVKDITEVKEAEIKDLQKELDVKITIQERLEREVLEITAAKEADIDRLKMQWHSTQKALDDAQEAALQKHQCLQTELEVVTSERDELLSSDASSKSEIKRLNSKVFEMINAKEAESRNLRRDLEESALIQNEVSALKSQMSEIAAAKENLEKELATTQKQLEDARKSVCNDQDQLKALSSDLVKLEANANTKETIISLLKKEYEQYQADHQAVLEKQMASSESKMDPPCLGDGKDRTFHDILLIIQKECSDIIAKSKVMAEELKSSRGVGPYDEFDYDEVEVLDEFTNSIVEMLVEGKVKKLLISFCHMNMIETASAENSIEVSLL